MHRDSPSDLIDESRYRFVRLSRELAQFFRPLHCPVTAKKIFRCEKQASKGKPLMLSSFADHGRGCPGLAGHENGVVMKCLLTHLLSLFA